MDYVSEGASIEHTAGASPIGAPGWLDFAFSTASTESMRMALTQS